MPPRHGVVADDLTGAGDTGVQFATAGLRTSLALADDDDTSVDADVLVVSTDSRSRPAEEAGTLVSTAVADLRERGVTRLFKKIDSTCRGPIAAEMSAALQESEPDTLALVCPAFPGTGRTVVGGYLLVDGQPVSRTSLATDPITPVTDSRVPELLAELNPHVVGLHTVAAGPEATTAALRRVHEAGGRVAVCDATSDADLATLVAAAGALDVPVLYTGAAGLAQPVAAAWAAEAAEEQVTTGSIVVVVGSVQPTTQAQLDRLVSTLGWPLLRPGAATVAGPDRQWNAYTDDALAGVTGQPDGLVIAAPATPADVEEARAAGREDGLPDDAAVAARVARRLAVLTASLNDRLVITGVVATGGDLARAVLSALGVTHIELTGEVEAGVPSGRCRLGGATCTIVTKAGGFGDEAALVRAVHHVRADARAR